MTPSACQLPRRFAGLLTASVVLLALTSGSASADGPRLSAGGFHTCAIDAGGAAKCWGLATSGQLGNGRSSPANFSTPVQVLGLGTGVTVITAGTNHSCAIKGGAVKCWGDGAKGELGNGKNSRSTRPSAVSGLASGVSWISAGEGHSCAVQAGAAKCWGEGERGELGNGTIASSNTPQQVTGLTSGVSEVTTGTQHSCAIQNGAAKCWGRGKSGELGDGAKDDSNSPVQVAGLTSGVSEIVAGGKGSCAIQNGALKCWGLETHFTADQTGMPVQISGLESGVTSISVGNGHLCAVHSGIAKCWGWGGSGELGNGSQGNESAPTRVKGLVGGVSEISAGQNHSCALRAGAVSCWGRGNERQLGNGRAKFAMTAQDVLFFGADELKIRSAPRSANAGRSITIKVACRSGCEIVPTLRVGGKRKQGLKLIKLRPKAKSVRIKLPAWAASLVHSAVRKGKKVTLTLTPTGGVSAGNPKTLRLR
jgi:alpha-tubulin suppressor-like RCC1 family protein